MFDSGKICRCFSYGAQAQAITQYHNILALQMSNPRGQQRDKPFRDALRMQIKAAGEDNKALRDIADALIAEAKTGDIQSIKEVADRLDGKVPQAIGGSDDLPPIQTEMTNEQRERALQLWLAKNGQQLTAKSE